MKPAALSRRLTLTSALSLALFLPSALAGTAQGIRLMNAGQDAAAFTEFQAEAQRGDAVA